MTAKDFEKKYVQLVKESSFQIVAIPQLVGTNHGTFEFAISYQVAKTMESKSETK